MEPALRRMPAAGWHGQIVATTLDAGGTLAGETTKSSSTAALSAQGGREVLEAGAAGEPCQAAVHPAAQGGRLVSGRERVRAVDEEGW